MAEYIERKSLEEDIKQYSHARIDNDAIYQTGLQFVDEMISILRIVEKQPTADVVEVVRSKDCVAKGKAELEPFVCSRNNILVYNNCFCSYGIRKEGAEE